MSKIEELNRQALISSLEKNKNNRTQVAKELGISIRTVRTWIKKYSLKKVCQCHCHRETEMR